MIVSGFQGARYSISVTAVRDIQTLREAIGTRDISPDVAQGLRARGIDAEAACGGRPNTVQARRGPACRGVSPDLQRQATRGSLEGSQKLKRSDSPWGS